MSEAEIRAWMLGPRRHWCVLCRTPVRRISSVARASRGFAVSIECHGQKRTETILDTYAEDHPNGTVRWFDCDGLILARIDRHGRINNSNEGI